MLICNNKPINKKPGLQVNLNNFNKYSSLEFSLKVKRRHSVIFTSPRTYKLCIRKSGKPPYDSSSNYLLKLVPLKQLSLETQKKCPECSG